MNKGDFILRCKGKITNGSIFLVIILFFIACGEGKSPNRTASERPENMQIDLSLTGEELFVKNCKLCHGIDGKLKLNGAKDLDESVLTLEERVVLIREGKNAMTSFKKLLSDEEIKKVAAYSLAFNK